MKTNKQSAQYSTFEAALKAVLSPEAKKRVDEDKLKRKVKRPSVSGRASGDKDS